MRTLLIAAGFVVGYLLYGWLDQRRRVREFQARPTTEPPKIFFRRDVDPTTQEAFVEMVRHVIRKSHGKPKVTIR